MQRLTFLLFTFAVMSFPHGAYCQYPPIGILPMEYNPSFAGSVGNSRIVSNLSYFNQHQSDNKGQSYLIDVSYDKYFPKIRSGIGIITQGSYNAYNILRSTIKYEHWSSSIELAIAPKFSMKGKYTFSPSLSIGYWNSYRNLDNTKTSIQDGFSSKFGLLFNATQYYIGYAIEYYYGNSDAASAFQFGYTFQKSNDSKFSFTPQFAFPILINSGIDVYWPSYNLSFRYDSFILGAISQFGYSYPTGFQAGWQNKGWRILFSNDFKDSYKAYLTLRYIFNHDKKSIHVFD